MAPRSICAHRADSRNSTHHLEYNPGASPMQIMLQNKSGFASSSFTGIYIYIYFWYHFGSLLTPFWCLLAPFWHSWAPFWRPWAPSRINMNIDKCVCVYVWRHMVVTSDAIWSGSICIYPDACGNPATVPWQGVVGIESDNDELLYIVSVSFLDFFL